MEKEQVSLPSSAKACSSCPVLVQVMKCESVRVQLSFHVQDYLAALLDRKIIFSPLKYTNLIWRQRWTLQCHSSQSGLFAKKHTWAHFLLLNGRAVTLVLCWYFPPVFVDNSRTVTLPSFFPLVIHCKKTPETQFPINTDHHLLSYLH